MKEYTKVLSWVIRALLLVGLSACQQPHQRSHCDTAKDDPACAPPKAIQRTVKPKYSKSFARDPHVKQQQVIEKTIEMLGQPRRQVKISSNNKDYKYRSYAHSVVSPSEHAPRAIRYNETNGEMRARTGSVQFDALLTLAQNELKKSHISKTSDANYQDGKPLDCQCFGNRKSKHYMSLGEIGLAGMFGLAATDAERLMNSLLFNISEYRSQVEKPKKVPGDRSGLQIVQREREFGSWPVDTSRMLWALAAENALHVLPKKSQALFSEQAYRALKNTIEIDRVAIFDGRDGLYFGGHNLNRLSDTRTHTRTHTHTHTHAGTILAGSKTLVVNLLNYHGLIFTSRLADQRGDVVSSVKYLDWALDLKNSINETFWDENLGLYFSWIDGDGNNRSPNYYWEQAFALTLNIPDKKQKQKIHRWQVPEWEGVEPFKAGMILNSAVGSQNVPLANTMYRFLIDSASIKMSNIALSESGVETSDLKAASAYVSMVYENLFGFNPSFSGVEFRPFIPEKIRNTQFRDQSSIALFDVKLRGMNFDVRIKLPKMVENYREYGVYPIRTISVNGSKVSGVVPWRELKNNNRVVITLGTAKENKNSMGRSRERSLHDFPGVEFPQVNPSVFQKKIKSYKKSQMLGMAKSAQKGKGWGGVDEAMEVSFSIDKDGIYKIDFKYRHPEAESKGIHNGVKWVGIHDENGNELLNRVLQFPLPRSGSSTWGYSTAIEVKLLAGDYTLRMEDFMNMSYLQVSAGYAGTGGRKGLSNRFLLRGVRIAHAE